MRFLIRATYHTMPDKTMRAIRYYSSRPTILGKPLLANVAIMTTEEELQAHRGELEPLMRAGVIEVRAMGGTLFTYPRDTSLDTGVIPEWALAEQQRMNMLEQMKGEPDPSIVVAEAAAALPDIPELEIPPELPKETEPKADPNEVFFSHVKKAVEKRSRRRKASGVKG